MMEPRARRTYRLEIRVSHGNWWKFDEKKNEKEIVPVWFQLTWSKRSIAAAAISQTNSNNSNHIFLWHRNTFFEATARILILWMVQSKKRKLLQEFPSISCYSQVSNFHEWKKFRNAFLLQKRMCFFVWTIWNEWLNSIQDFFIGAQKKIVQFDWIQCFNPMLSILTNISTVETFLYHRYIFFCT